MVLEMIVSVVILFYLDKYTSDKERGCIGRVFVGFFKLVVIFVVISIIPQWITALIIVASIAFGIYGLINKKPN
jgi:hypothetical protein